MSETEGTPILRADALDDDLQHDDFYQRWGHTRDEVLPGFPENEPRFAEDDEVPFGFAEGGIVTTEDDGTDVVPALLECYENGEGGWSYRRVVR